jgi:peptide methionine sulfoxide reductase MsrB
MTRSQTVKSFSKFKIELTSAEVDKHLGHSFYTLMKPCTRKPVNKNFYIDVMQQNCHNKWTNGH